MTFRSMTLRLKLFASLILSILALTAVLASAHASPSSGEWNEELDAILDGNERSADARLREYTVGLGASQHVKGTAWTLDVGLPLLAPSPERTLHAVGEVATGNGGTNLGERYRAFRGGLASRARLTESRLGMWWLRAELLAAEVDGVQDRTATDRARKFSEIDATARGGVELATGPLTEGLAYEWNHGKRGPGKAIQFRLGFFF